MNANEKILQLLREASDLSNFTIGELALEIRNRMPAHTNVRINPKGVRVSNSRYFDSLKTPSDINAAIAAYDKVMYG